jgi:hypothetical protein
MHSAQYCAEDYRRYTIPIDIRYRECTHLCMLGYIGFNDVMFRDLLQNPHKQSKLLWYSVVIFVKYIFVRPLCFFHIINYITTITGCIYWVYIQPWTPSIIHRYIMCMMVSVHIIQVVICEFYNGFWMNGKVGLQLILSIRTYDTLNSTALNRHYRKVWTDMYISWNSAAACEIGQGSPDLSRSLFYSMSPLLIPIEEVQYHEFARTFQLLFRYMLLFDRTEFMIHSTNLLSHKDVLKWGILNQAACRVFQPSTQDVTHALVYRTA